MTQTLVTSKKWKLDIGKLADECVNAAFLGNKERCEEIGLSDRAIEDKRSVIAIRESVRRFMEATLALNREEIDADKKAHSDYIRTNPEYMRMLTIRERQWRHEVEKIAEEALSAGGDCIEVLQKYCI